jgi:hypothetical protein
MSEKKLKWHWDPSRRCFYEGALAEQRWCLPENIVKVLTDELAARPSPSEEALREAARAVLAYPNIQKFMGSILFDGLMSAITYTPSPADGEPSFTMEELKAMKAKLDEPFPAPSEPKEGA